MPEFSRASVTRNLGCPALSHRFLSPPRQAPPESHSCAWHFPMGLTSLALVPRCPLSVLL